jgi:hypothetical protein
MHNEALHLLDEALSLLSAGATPQMQERAALRLIEARVLLSHTAPHAEPSCPACWPNIGIEHTGKSPVSAPAVSHADAVQIVHEEAGRTLSKDDFDLCMRIAKRALTRPEPAAPAQDGETAWHRERANTLYHVGEKLRDEIKVLRAQLSTARAAGRREGIEEAANVCDRHARASWNDDRSTQAKLDTKEIRNLLNKENSDD